MVLSHRETRHELPARPSPLSASLDQPVVRPSFDDRDRVRLRRRQGRCGGARRGGGLEPQRLCRPVRRVRRKHRDGGERAADEPHAAAVAADDGHRSRWDLRVPTACSADRGGGRPRWPADRGKRRSRGEAFTGTNRGSDRRLQHCQARTGRSDEDVGPGAGRRRDRDELCRPWRDRRPDDGPGRPGSSRNGPPGVALGRLGDAREIAAVASFLASPSASSVTGVSWPVDGGMPQLGPQAGSHLESRSWRTPSRARRRPRRHRTRSTPAVQDCGGRASRVRGAGPPWSNRRAGRRSCGSPRRPRRGSVRGSRSGRG